MKGQTKKQEEEVKQAMKQSPPKDEKNIYLIYKDAQAMKVMFPKD